MTGPRILVWLQEDRGEIAGSSWGAARLAARLAASAGGSAVGTVLTAGTSLPETLDSRSGLEAIWSVRHQELALYSQETYLAGLRRVWLESGANLFFAVATPDGEDLVVALSLDQNLPCATRAVGLHQRGETIMVDQAVPLGGGVRSVCMTAGGGCVALDPRILEAGLPTLEEPATAYPSSSPRSQSPPGGEGFSVRSYLVPPVSTVSPLSVPTGGRSPVPPGGGGAVPSLVQLDVDLPPAHWPAVAVEAADPTTMDIAEAEFVVAGGRGYETAARFGRVWALAETLGAAVGVTRPAVDEGWAPFERQIGQTGRYLSARVYLGLGVSGATHHTAGIADCGFVVAVNHDPNAPIFQVADVGFVADVDELTQALRKEVARRKQRRGLIRVDVEQGSDA